MPCFRCNGMQVPEVIGEGGMRTMALRCLHCGDIVDQVIARNRMRRQRIVFSRPRTPTYGRRPIRNSRFVEV